MSTPEDISSGTLHQEKVQLKEGIEKPSESLPEAIQEKAEESKEDRNWKAFREARKKERQETEAALKKAAEKEAEAAALKAAMEAAFAKESRYQQPTESYQQQYQEHDISEDERIEKKVVEALAKRAQEEERRKIEQEQQEYPSRLLQTYPDFHSLISETNLDYLEYHFPEVAAPLKRLPDNYDKWSDIYRAIKKFVPNSQNASRDASRADQNHMKPKSMSSVGATQSNESMGNARLSEERKAANWERMQKALRGIS